MNSNADRRSGFLSICSATLFRFRENSSRIDERLSAACKRLPPRICGHDLRHTFATRLLEQGVHHYVISALLGHATPMTGFGAASRMTRGYAHATWDMMVTAVAMLEQPL